MSNDPHRSPLELPRARRGICAQRKSAGKPPWRRSFDAARPRRTDAPPTALAWATGAAARQRIARAGGLLAIIEKITRPLRGVHRLLRFDHHRNPKSPTIKPRNPRVTSARVPGEAYKIAAPRSA